MDSAAAELAVARQGLPNDPTAFSLLPYRSKARELGGMHPQLRTRGRARPAQCLDRPTGIPDLLVAPTLFGYGTFAGARCGCRS